MPRHVALLRAVNVGGRGKLPMADLRACLLSAGYTSVVTYIQSGNVVFVPPGQVVGGAIAADIDRIVDARFGLDVHSVVLTHDELMAVERHNPYRSAENSKALHVLFTRAPIGPAAAERVANLVARAATAGGPERAEVAGSVVYLYLPNGMGRSELVPALARGGAAAVVGTARNWTTVTKLLELCGSSA
ncbi:MAG: DUF1697 domain-containing protein [Sporichthyaceae bacterium]|nr:DUF1697 domain-containing protein [Sporichthyaceae bacterium]